MSGTGQNGVQQSGGSSRAVCVLLRAFGSAVPTALLASLAQRITTIRSFTDSYPALAEACALSHSAPVVLVLIEPTTIPDAAELVRAVQLHVGRSTIWWYSERSGKKLAKLNPNENAPWTAAATTPTEPSPPPPTGPRLASTFGPETPRLKPGGAPAFRPATRGPKSANEPPRVVVRPGGGVGIRRLRLVGEVPPAPATPAPPPPPGPFANGQNDPRQSPSEDQPPRVPLLTEEELRMLLSDDLPDDTRGSDERSER